MRLRLIYEGGGHRYYPKLSSDGRTWTPIESAFYTYDPVAKDATLQRQIGPEALWVAAQELITSGDFARWIEALAVKPFVTQRVIGESKQGRPLHMLEITEDPDPSRYVLVISRQHPPEVTGTLAALPFLETIAGESQLARSFRRRFSVWAGR